MYIIEGIENVILLVITLMIICFLYILHCLISLINRFNSSYNLHSTYEVQYQEFLNQVRNDNVQNDTQNRCPICLESSKYSIKTSCSHMFCGQCLIGWTNTVNHIGGTTCPVCRTLIKFLLQYFSQDEMLSDSSEKSDVTNFVRYYNRRYSGMPLSVIDQIRDFPTILRNGIWRIIQGDFTFAFRMRIIIIIAGMFLYVLSPLDILPEILFGVFGFIDDIAAIFLTLSYLNYLFRRSLTN